MPALKSGIALAACTMTLLAANASGQQNALLNLDVAVIQEWIATRAAPASSPQDGLLTEVNVVDLETGEVRMNRVVRFRQGRWEAEYTPTMALLNTYPSQSMGGAYMMPGFVDSHVHLAEFLLDAMPLFTRYGVTHVVNLSGSEGHIALSREIETRASNLPHLDTSGPFFQTEKSMDARAACDLVSVQLAQGYKAIKFYQESMQRLAFRAFLDCVADQDVRVFGHLIDAGEISDLLGSDFIIAHAEELLGTLWHGQENWIHDDAMRCNVAESLAKSGVSLIPNLALYQRIISMQDDEKYEAMLSVPEMALMPVLIKQLYGPGNPYRADRSQEETESAASSLKKNYVAMEAFTACFDRAGGHIFVGSDAPNPMAIYGVSYLQELAALEKAGVPRLRVLRAAVNHPLRPEGKDDYIFLEQNPLDARQPLGRPRAIILGGRFIQED